MLRTYLLGLRQEDKALLKILADAGVALQQRTIMQELPFLRGKNSASLRSLKSHVNAGCRQLDCAQILSDGSGSGDYRIHEINRDLGDLHPIVIEVAKEFDISWPLLEREQPHDVNQGGRKMTSGFRSVGSSRGWFLIERDGEGKIAALVNAKGACSCRFYDASAGHFRRKLPNARGTFRTAFSDVIREGKEFRPPHQPDLVSTEKQGLPLEVLHAAQSS
jgi:hypothetical protein